MVEKGQVSTTIAGRNSNLCENNSKTRPVSTKKHSRKNPVSTKTQLKNPVSAKKTVETIQSVQKSSR